MWYTPRWFGMVLMAPVLSRCKKWFGDKEGKKTSDRVMDVWKAVAASRKNDFQGHLKQTFAKSTSKNEHTRVVVSKYVEQLKESDGALDECHCGVSKSAKLVTLPKCNHSHHVQCLA